MAVAVTKVVVNASSLFRTAGMASLWFGAISRQLGNNTRASAPHGVTGVLKKSIHTVKTNRASRLEMFITLSVEAPYARYVLRGTPPTETQWIRPKYTRSLNTKPHPRYRRTAEPYPGGHFRAVRGQAANNFLLKGWMKTSRRHRSMAGAIPSSVANP